MKAGVIVLSVVVIGCVGVLWAQSQQQPIPNPVPAAPGYSAQIVVVPFGSALAITDHAKGKYYVYSMDDKEMKLKLAVDLTKAGQPRLTAETPPATQPAKDRE